MVSGEVVNAWILYGTRWAGDSSETPQPGFDLAAAVRADPTSTEQPMNYGVTDAAPRGEAPHLPTGGD